MKNFKLIVIILSLILTANCFAQDFKLDDQTKEFCNEIMTGIFNDILNEKGQFKELAGFSSDALKKNDNGILSIDYELKDGNDAPFKFLLTIANISDDSYVKPGYKNLNYSFPLLSLKFTGHQNILLNKDDFDIQKYIQKYGIKLWEYQQEVIPYKMELKPLKEVFKVGEKIEFIVTLTNKTSHNIVLKELNSNTVFFLFDGVALGAESFDKSAVSKSKDIVVKSGESISKPFASDAYTGAREFEISGSYALTYKGIRPTAKAKVTVIP